MEGCEARNIWIATEEGSPFVERVVRSLGLTRKKRLSEADEKLTTQRLIGNRDPKVLWCISQVLCCLWHYPLKMVLLCVDGMLWNHASNLAAADPAPPYQIEVDH